MEKNRDSTVDETGTGSQVSKAVRQLKSTEREPAEETEGQEVQPNAQASKATTKQDVFRKNEERLRQMQEQRA